MNYLILLLGLSGTGATINVTAGVAEPTAGSCSLREAIANADDGAATFAACTAGTGYDTVVVPAGTYAMVSRLEIHGSSGITITGAGAASTIIEHADGAAADHVFFLAKSGGTIKISNVTIRRASAGKFGLQNSSQQYTATTLENVIVSDNLGTGIYNGASMTISGSTIARNHDGGLTHQGQAALNIQSCTISDNEAITNSGGGLQLWNIYSVYVQSSTISGNRTRFAGGGVACAGQVGGGSGLSLTNVTITNNTANSDTAGDEGGGGFFNPLGASTCTTAVNNSIIAGNNSAGGQTKGPDCEGSLVSTNGYNLIGNLTDCTLGGTRQNNVEGQPALLGPLADNGGPTQTHALVKGSPAINHGYASVCGSVDQRGRSRLLGPACDIGAYELDAADLVLAVADLPIVTGTAPLTYTFTLGNDGPNPVPNASLAVSLPTGATLQSATGASCTGTTAVSCTVTLLAPNTSVAITLTASTPVSSGSVMMSAQASTSGAVPELDARDNSVTLTTLVNPVNVAVSASAVVSRVGVGDVAAYSLTVSNSGAATASNVQLAIQLPSTVTIVAATSTAGTCSAFGTVSCMIGEMAAGAIVSVNVTAKTSIAGAAVVSATVTASEPDTDMENNASTSAVEVTTAQPMNGPSTTSTTVPASTTTPELPTTSQRAAGCTASGAHDLAGVAALLLLGVLRRRKPAIG